MGQRSPKKLLHHLILLSFTRTLTSTAHRMVYPFLTVFARGLGVSLEMMGTIIAIRQAIGIGAPILSPLGDTWGRKRAMSFGLVLFILSVSLIAIWPSFTTFVIGILLAAIGKTITDPAIFAYIGDKVSHSRLGTAIALSEFSWSGAFLIGIPLLGWVISRTSWVSPFPILAVFCLPALILIWRVVPDERTKHYEPQTLAKSIRDVAANRSATAIILLGPLLGSASSVITIIYGAWLEGTFGFSIAAIGFSTTAIGIAELLGEGLVAAFLTRIGRKRALVIGVTLNIVAAVCLPFSESSALFGILALFGLFITYEFGVVAKLPMMIDLVPHAPATTIGIGASAHRFGTALGIFLGPILFQNGILANSFVAVVLDIFALLILIFYVKEIKPKESPELFPPKDSIF